MRTLLLVTEFVAVERDEDDSCFCFALTHSKSSVHKDDREVAQPIMRSYVAARYGGNSVHP